MIRVYGAYYLEFLTANYENNNYYFVFCPKEFEVLKFRLDDLKESLPVPEEVLLLVWDKCIRNMARVLVDGYLTPTTTDLTLCPFSFNIAGSFHTYCIYIYSIYTLQ